MKKYNETELTNLINEIETQFNSHLSKAEEATTTVMAKAESEEEAPKAKDEDEKKDDESEDESEDKDKKKDKKKDDEKEEGDKPAFLEKSEYSESDKSELNKLYAEMSKSERETHFEALKSTMPAGETPMVKSEDTLSKAESEIAALKKSNEDLQKGMSELVAALKKSRPAAPKGKAVTGLSALNKSEGTEAKIEMSREEAKKILSKKAQSTTLEKSDRNLINAFAFGTVGLDAVQHLLK